MFPQCEKVKFIKPTLMETIKDFKFFKRLLIGSNPNFTWDDIKNTDFELWDWQDLSTNPNMTLDIIKSNPHGYWYSGYLCENKSINHEFVISRVPPDLNIYKMPCASNPSLFSTAFIENNLDKPWDWEYLSSNPNLTWDIVQSNPNLPWDWDKLSENPSITWDIVKNNLDKPWDVNGLAMNKNVFLSDLLKTFYPKTCSAYAFSSNLNITIEDIRKNPTKCYWEVLSKNPNITLDIIEKSMDLPWDQVAIFANPNTPFSRLVENPTEDNTLYFGNNHGCYNDHVFEKMCRNSHDTMDKILEN